jgi:hypothetical protein
LRTAALDLIVQVFHYYPTQRPSILNEILISLKKMPASQNSRDFKLLKGGSIQVVSALIMRIIQSAASGYNDSHLNEGNTSLASELALEADRLKAFRTDVRQPKKSAKKGKPMTVQVLFGGNGNILPSGMVGVIDIVDLGSERASGIRGWRCSIKGIRWCL